MTCHEEGCKGLVLTVSVYDPSECSAWAAPNIHVNCEGKGACQQMRLKTYSPSTITVTGDALDALLHFDAQLGPKAILNLNCVKSNACLDVSIRAQEAGSEVMLSCQESEACHVVDLYCTTISVSSHTNCPTSCQTPDACDAVHYHPAFTPAPVDTPVPHTAVPTAVPTPVPETDVPTSVPTDVPTSVPTAAPTPSPPGETLIPETDAPPTAVPTAVPTDVPTAVPDTAVPTSAPTAVPTAVPETAVPANSSTPAPKPSLSTVAPQPNTTASPDGSDTGHNSSEPGAAEYPPEYLVSGGPLDITIALAWATATVASALPAAGAVGRVCALLHGAGCRIDTPDGRLEWFVSPTRMSLGTHPNRYYLGAVVGNAAVSSSIIAVFYVLDRCRKRGSFRLFGMSLVPVYILLPATMVCSLQLVFRWGRAPSGVGLVGALGALMCLALPLLLNRWVLTAARFKANMSADPQASECEGWSHTLRIFVFSEKMWVSVPFGKEFVGKFRACFETYKEPMRRFLLFDMAFSLLVGSVMAWTAEDRAMCDIRNVVATVLCVAYTLCLACWAPHLSNYDNYTMLGFSIATAAAYTLSTVSVLADGGSFPSPPANMSQEIPPPSSVSLRYSEGLFVGVLLAVAMKCVGDVASLWFGGLERRRKGEEWEDDLDGSNCGSDEMMNTKERLDEPSVFGVNLKQRFVDGGRSIEMGNVSEDLLVPQVTHVSLMDQPPRVSVTPLAPLQNSTATLPSCVSERRERSSTFAASHKSDEDDEDDDDDCSLDESFSENPLGTHVDPLAPPTKPRPQSTLGVASADKRGFSRRRGATSIVHAPFGLSVAGRRATTVERPTASDALGSAAEHAAARAAVEDCVSASEASRSSSPHSGPSLAQPLLSSDSSAALISPTSQHSRSSPVSLSKSTPQALVPRTSGRLLCNRQSSGYFDTEALSGLFPPGPVPAATTPSRRQSLVPILAPGVVALPGTTVSPSGGQVSSSALTGVSRLIGTPTLAPVGSPAAQRARTSSSFSLAPSGSAFACLSPTLSPVALTPSRVPKIQSPVPSSALLGAEAGTVL